MGIIKIADSLDAEGEVAVTVIGNNTVVEGHEVVEWIDKEKALTIILALADVFDISYTEIVKGYLKKESDS